jgi:hypothetical protein
MSRFHLILSFTHCIENKLKMGRQHQMAFRVARHEDEAEQFKAKEESHAGMIIGSDTSIATCSGDAGGFFHIRSQAFQGGRGIEPDVRHVGQAGNDDNGDNRLYFRWLHTSQLPDPQGRQGI